MPKKKKQSHAQDNIYVVRQFAYVHGVAGISLLSGKNTKYKNWAYNLFSLIKNTTTLLKETLITQSRFLYIKMGQKNFPLGPLHGLSLSKSPIKNHARLFYLGRVGSLNQIKRNQAPQSPTLCSIKQTYKIRILPQHVCFSYAEEIYKVFFFFFF